MFTFVLPLLLGAAAPSLALPHLNTASLPAGEGDLFTELLAQDLASLGVKVLTSRDVGAVVGLERQKELLGCAESSCVAELSNALGVDGLITGDVVVLGGAYVLTVKVLSAKDGGTLAWFNGRSPSSKEVPDALLAAARDVARQLASAWNRPELAPPAALVTAPAGPPLDKRWALVPGIAGVAFVAAGIALQVESAHQFELLQQAASPQAALKAKGVGQTIEPLANVSLGIGAAGLAAAVVVFVLGKDAPVQPTAWVSPTGGGVAVTGVLP